MLLINCGDFKDQRDTGMNKRIKQIGIPLILLIIIIIVLRNAGFRVYRYAPERNSMHPTITPGDLVLCVVNRTYTSEKLMRGAVVLITHKDYSYLLTKRIIGKEKDRVEIRGQLTLVNGEMLDEPYALFGPEDKRYGRVEPMRIPKDKLFVLGDNRDISLDSRSSSFGLVDVRQVVGKPLLILWSKNKQKIGNWLQRKSKVRGIYL